MHCFGVLQEERWCAEQYAQNDALGVKGKGKYREKYSFPIFEKQKEAAKIARNEWNDCLEELGEWKKSDRKHWWKCDFSEDPFSYNFDIWILKVFLYIQKGKLYIKEQNTKKIKAKNQMESIKLTTYEVGKIITQKWVVLSDIWA